MNHTLHGLLRVDLTGTTTFQPLIDTFTRYFAQCSVLRADPLSDQLTVSFYWIYKDVPSRVFQYFIGKDDDSDFEVKTVLTLHAFCASILVPYWCVRLTPEPNQQAVCLLLDYFMPKDEEDKLDGQADQPFIDKPKIITEGLKYLQSQPVPSDVRITAVEWECVFYIANQTHTMTELKQNVQLRDDVIKGMSLWYQQCTDDLSKREEEEKVMPINVQ